MRGNEQRGSVPRAAAQFDAKEGNSESGKPKAPVNYPRVPLYVGFPNCWDGVNLDSQDHQFASDSEHYGLRKRDASARSGARAPTSFYIVPWAE